VKEKAIVALVREIATIIFCVLKKKNIFKIINLPTTARCFKICPAILPEEDKEKLSRSRLI